MGDQVFTLNVVKAFKVEIASGEIKTCTVRWPTDEEWCRRIHNLKMIRTEIGRNKSITETPDTERTDAELFAKIRMDEDGVPFDAYEASEVISRLDVCSVEQFERNGRGFNITMGVPGGSVTVTLKMPMARQVSEYNRASPKPISGKRTTEIRSALEPAGTLFDELVQGSDGYAGAVPITHKWVAVRELLEQVDQLVSGPVTIIRPEDAGPAQ